MRVKALGPEGGEVGGERGGRFRGSLLSLSRYYGNGSGHPPWEVKWELIASLFR
jgi:hypothetical protein